MRPGYHAGSVLLEVLGLGANDLHHRYRFVVLISPVIGLVAVHLAEVLGVQNGVVVTPP